MLHAGEGGDVLSRFWFLRLVLFLQLTNKTLQPELQGEPRSDQNHAASSLPDFTGPNKSALTQKEDESGADELTPTSCTSVVLPPAHVRHDT